MKNYVVTSGCDCDGFYSCKVYEFETEVEANEFAENCNQGSDGVLYNAVNRKQAIKYCEENDKKFNY